MDAHTHVNGASHVPSRPSSSALPRAPSKLPGLSRLPASRSNLKSAAGDSDADHHPATTAAAAPPQTPAPPKTIPTPKLAKPAAAAAVPKLVKRPSSTAVARPPQSSLAPPKSTTNGRPNLPAARKLAPKSSSSSLVPPRSRLQKPSISNLRPRASAEDDENHDQLTSLDSFPAAARQPSEDELVPEPVGDVHDSSTGPSGIQRRSSRPSLTERTIESLNSVPSTPSDRRRSSFFNPHESPMGPPPRPGSALSRNGRSFSRPGTSDGASSKMPALANSPAKRVSSSAKPTSRTLGIGSGISGPAGSKIRSASTGLTSKLQQAKAASQVSQTSLQPAAKATSGIPSGLPSKPVAGNKAAAPSRLGLGKPRPALGKGIPSVKRTAQEAGASAASSATPSTASTEGKRAVSNASAALREQIAAAKAAARKEKENAAKRDSQQDVSAANHEFDFDIHADPFNQAPKDDKHILRNRVNNARTSGKLNISAMGLKDFPEEVRNMYNSAAMAEGQVNWAEVVDLTKLIATDNEFEHLDDSVFPDRSVEDLAMDDESEGNQFGGLELLDLHRNSLQTLPMGLRRLERLTSLNVAHNKLENGILDLLADMPSLKEIRLGNNNLTGSLPTSICGLTNLEVLDMQANRLLGLPEALRELVSLRVLNVSGNQLTALPMEALERMPLTELDASSNALIASLFPLGGPTGHPTLQILDVSNNSLAALTFSETLELPQLRSLHLTNNHLTALPSVTGWQELITLQVGDNEIADFPVGFTSLMKLRIANFTSNEIRMLDPEISRMESLESLVLASNPLREKKFLNMNGADIKRDLKARLAPEQDDSPPGSPITVIGDATPPSIWILKANNLLDLAGHDLSDDLNDALGTFLHAHEAKQIHLQHNNLSCIPPALWIAHDHLRTLDLSGNSLSPDYLSDDLSLPSLRDLNLSRCRLDSLVPLTTHLHAPALHALNLTANRLTGDLPPLRHTYPALTAFHASDNKIRSVSVAALRGLQTVNLASNDIEHLPPEIGLLWDEGLRIFEVGSNAFRMPNYRTLEKGTEATLRWLRDRLPADVA